MTRGARTVLAVLAALALLGPVPSAAAGAPPQPTWHAAQAAVPEARAAGRDGEGVLVAVLDTWVDADHADLEGRVVPGADCTSGTCREGAAVADPCDHGTHVAGTVASSSYGVAPRALVLPVRVLAHDAAASPPACNGSVSGVAAGIRYAVAKGARVVNLSLGTLVPGLSSSSAIGAAVDEAARAGVLVVFAAGNASLPITDSYGGSALIVAATGPSGQLAGYSQRGAGVSLAAPGGDPGGGACSPERCVTSLFPGGRYAVAAGTSMAAPHVAGTAALLLAQDPARSHEQVADRLLSSARPLLGAGAGVLDAAAALATPTGQSAVPGSPVPPPAPRAPAATTAPPPPASAPPAAAAPGSGSAELPPSALPLPLQPPADAVAQQPAVAAPVPLAGEPPVAASGLEALPEGPVTLAAGLLAVAALSTSAAGLSRRSSQR